MNDDGKFLIETLANFAIDLDLVMMMESQINVLERQLKETNKELNNPDKERLIKRNVNLEEMNAWLWDKMNEDFKAKVALELENKKIEEKNRRI